MWSRSLKYQQGRGGEGKERREREPFNRSNLDAW